METETQPTIKGIITSRSQIQNFDNGCISSSTELSKIIQIGEKIDNPFAGQFSHEFKILNLNGVLTNIEADEPGIVSNPFDEYLKSTTVTGMLILRPKFTYTQADQDYCLSFVGKMRYDFLGLPDEGFRFLTEYLQKEYDKILAGGVTGNEHGIWLGKSDSPKTSMCGEFCSIVDNHAFSKSNVPNGTTIGLKNELMPDLVLNEVAPSDSILCQYYDVYLVDLPALRKEIGQ
jgi:hypothetical protein